MDVSQTATQGGEGLRLQDAGLVIDLFARAAESNLSNVHRRGATIYPPAQGILIMTGDLHDHQPNLRKILKLADLEANPDRHLVLHEVVHGPNQVQGRDLSARTLAVVAAMKAQFPDQVHVILSNHELSQINGDGILKGGRSVVKMFDEGLEFIYGDRAEEVNTSICRFIRTLPLAVKCPNGILCSHSLPSARKIRGFDPAILNRIPTDADLDAGGSAYEMVWGRSHTASLLEHLGQLWDVNQFIIGHQSAEMGFDLFHDRLLVLASDHNHGVALPIDLSRPYDTGTLMDSIIPLASIVLG